MGRWPVRPTHPSSCYFSPPLLITVLPLDLVAGRTDWSLGWSRQMYITLHTNRTWSNNGQKSRNHVQHNTLPYSFFFPRLIPVFMTITQRSRWRGNTDETLTSFIGREGTWTSFSRSHIWQRFILTQASIAVTAARESHMIHIVRHKRFGAKCCRSSKAGGE